MDTLHEFVLNRILTSKELKIMFIEKDGSAEDVTSTIKYRLLEDLTKGNDK